MFGERTYSALPNTNIVFVLFWLNDDDFDGDDVDHNDDDDHDDGVDDENGDDDVDDVVQILMMIRLIELSSLSPFYVSNNKCVEFNDVDYDDV